MTESTAIMTRRQRLSAWWQQLRKRNLMLALAACMMMPAMFIAASWAWTALQALPDVRFTSEQMSTLSWLPVISLYAAAAIVMAVFFNNAFSYEPGHSVEAGWHDLALAGNKDARWLLIRNDIRWFVLLAMSGAFFWMSR